MARGLQLLRPAADRGRRGVARSERRALYARPTGLGQAFNFDLLKADFDAAEFRDVITFCLNEAGKAGSSSTWVLSNHDVVRHTSRYALPAGTDFDEWLMSDGALPLADEIAGLRRARAATLLMLALPGSSYLYQGEELGLHEVSDLPAHALQDPIWLRTLQTKKGRDGCRVPLPWTDDGDSFGFGSGPSWLPQPAGVLAHRGRGADRPARVDARALPEALRVRRQLQTAEELTWVVPTARRCCTSSAPAAGTASPTSATIRFRCPRAWSGLRAAPSCPAHLRARAPCGSRSGRGD